MQPSRAQKQAQLIAELHAEFRRYVPACPEINHPMGGYDDKHIAWRTFLQRGWTLDDLKCVLEYVTHEVRKGWSPSSLTFQLIRRDNKFENHLMAARAWAQKRRAKPGPRTTALREWRGLPEGDPKDTAKPVGRLLPDYIAQMRAAVDGSAGAP